MRLLDEQYTATPFYGVRRMTAWLRQPGLCGQSQARPPAAAADGAGSDLSQAPAQPAGRGPYDLPLSAARGEGGPGQPGVECGYHLYPLAVGICVPGGGDRLVQPVCAVLGGVDHDGRAVLCGGAGAGPQPGPAGDFQHRPRGAVHESGVHGSGCSKEECGSVWMAAAGPWTTCLWSGCGGR